MPPEIPAALSLLQGKVVVVVFGKIHSLCLDGNALAGIVFKLPALVIVLHHTFFGAKNQTFIAEAAVNTVLAGFWNIFAEQHRNYLAAFCFLVLYNNRRGKATEIFTARSKIHTAAQRIGGTFAC